MRPSYFCPETRKPLIVTDAGLERGDGLIYGFVSGWNGIAIPNFLSQQIARSANKLVEQYTQQTSVAVYRNFLDWLFQTFNEGETSFRSSLVEKLQLVKGARVLVTGCGLGDDVLPILRAIGPDGEVYMQDISPTMVVAASEFVMRDRPDANVHLSISDAVKLPFADDFFDGAFHFGGINLFNDVRSAIVEMDRVVKPGGRVVFGDEGVAPWLKRTEYGRIAINNNALWAADVPIDLLPKNAADVTLSWVLGNCFYVVNFRVSNQLPQINMDVPHKGNRGGSMRTRYFGQLEGVTEDSKRFVLEDAKRRGMSVHHWLEDTIATRRNQMVVSDRAKNSTRADHAGEGG